MIPRSSLIVAQSALEAAADNIQGMMDSKSPASRESYLQDVDKEFIRAADALGYVVMHVEKMEAAE